MDDLANASEESLLAEAVETWFSSTDAGGVSEGFDRLVNTWGMEDVLCLLAEQHWDDAAVPNKMLQAGRFRHELREPGTQLHVAYHYRCIQNGGAQRVAAELCNLWAGMVDDGGAALYDVTLITDGGPMEDEYLLDPRVRREYLPDQKESVGRTYRERYRAWQRIIDDDGIDVVIYGMWEAPSATWDLLSVKGAPTRPAFLLHCHNFTMVPNRSDSSESLRLMYLYRLCDGAAVLSGCDRSYVGRFCANARYIPNPLGYIADSTPAEPEGPSIVWTGRISAEKQPMNLVRMMGRVVDRMPDARLYIVGEGDEGLASRMHDEASRLSLDGNIVFAGFTTDVGAWYRRAAVCVCTSRFEGFPLTISEALSHSLPVVTYDFPWLEFVRDGRGIRTVEQGRWDLMAEEVVRLLQNPEEARRLGHEGRGQINDLLKVDIGGEWQTLFEGIDPDARPVGWDSDERVLFQYANEFQEEGKQRLRNRNSALKSKLDTCAIRLSARLDIKNTGAETNDVEILKISDPDAKEETPDWFRDESGIGHVVPSDAGSLDMRLRCIGNGDLRLSFRGREKKDADGVRVPVWIDCTSLIVDGELAFEGTRAVWHDRPFVWKYQVKDGQIVKISVSWHSHDQRGIEVEEARIDALRAESSQLRSQVKELSDALEEQKAERKRLSQTFTARFDIKNTGAETNDVRVLEISDPDAAVEEPEWIRAGNGKGHVIESPSGNLRMRLHCKGDGKLQFTLRGQDVRDADSERIPAWIDYTSLVVDGEQLLEGTRAAWHDEPIRWMFPVKDGQVVEVSASWHSHDETGLKIEEARLDTSQAANETLCRENDRLQQQVDKQNADIGALRSSKSWKVGRFATWLPRKVRDLLKR